MSNVICSSLLRALIMGLPGSGKGTISQRIVKDFKIYHLSSGDLLRSHIANKTEAGVAARNYVDNGQLVPDDIMLDLILGELVEISPHSWLLDGFPRTKLQAERLQKKRPIDTMMYLDVSIEEIVSRVAGRMTHITSGRTYNKNFNPPILAGKDDVTGEDLVIRDDDKPEVITKRLETYQQLTAPMLIYFKDMGLLKTFSGETTDIIWPNVHEYLSTHLEPKQFTTYSGVQSHP